jgi:hypothetical protein
LETSDAEAPRECCNLVEHDSEKGGDDKRDNRWFDFEALDEDDDGDYDGEEKCLMICPVGHPNKDEKNTQAGTTGQVTIDSGAAVSVIPSKYTNMFPITPPPPGQEGKFYRAANGSEIPDLGQQNITFKTKGGGLRSMNFRVADVTKPLGAVSKICHKGNKVVFDVEGSYIEHKATGTRTALREERGVYVLDIELVRRSAASNDGNAVHASPFGRQGQ